MTPVPEYARVSPEIAWAARRMPVLSEIGRRLAQTGMLRGIGVGVGLVLEPKTANLALMLRAAGANVSVYCPGHSTTADVANALAGAGMAVFADPAADALRDEELARKCLQTRPTILVDDGATLIRLAHRQLPGILADMLGATEETTSGVRPLRVMAKEGRLHLPVIAVNDAPTKYLFDNVYGTGQSCVMAFLDLTNLQLAGKVVAVLGYGWVGQGVARHAAALGARVVVSELNAVKALQAHHDGYEVRSLTDAASEVQVVFAATGIAGAVTQQHLKTLRDGAILCTAGAGPWELPMDYLASLGTAAEVLPEVMQYRLPTGRGVLVVSGGECVNCSAGEGNPIEVMDLSLSLQALAVERVAGEASNWPPGVYTLDPAGVEEVAAARLRHEGATLEQLTDDLARAMRKW